MGHASMMPEHLLLGVAQEPGSAAFLLFDKHELRLGPLRAEVEAYLGLGDSPRLRAFDPSSFNVMEMAVREATALNRFKAGTEHVLLALLRLEGSLAAEILLRHGITREVVMAHIHHSTGTE